MSERLTATITVREIKQRKPDFVKLTDMSGKTFNCNDERLLGVWREEVGGDGPRVVRDLEPGHPVVPVVRKRCAVDRPGGGGDLEARGERFERQDRFDGRDRSERFDRGFDQPRFDSRERADRREREDQSGQGQERRAQIVERQPAIAEPALQEVGH